MQLTSTLLAAALLLPLSEAPSVRAQESREQSTAPKLFEIGKPVDLSITLTDITGKTHSFSEAKQRLLVIDFWSHRCPWSKRSESKLLALAAEFKEDDVLFLAINSNASDLAEGEAEAFLGMRAYCKKAKLTYPVLRDPGNVIADRFQAEVTPHLFVIDAKGILRYSGGIDDDPRGKKNAADREDWARLAIRALLDGSAVPEPKTSPFGCSIKRVKNAKN